MLTVTELANQSGATPHAVRYYTRLGLLRPEQNPNNGYHYYDPREIARLRFIRQAKRLGYTLKEINHIMQDADQGRSPCPRVREIMQQRIVENRRELEALMTLQMRMEDALLDWANKPDDIPDGYSVCHLIESFSAGIDETRVKEERS